MEYDLARLSSIVEEMVDGVTVTDLCGKIIYVNRAVTKQLGYEKEELTGKLPLEFIAEKDRPKFIAESKKVSSGEPIPKVSEYLAKRKDGTKIPLSANFSVFRDHKGRPNKIIVVSRDITERKKAEDAIARSKKELNQIFETATDAIRVIDQNFNVTKQNSAMSTLSGTDKTSLSNNSVF